MHARFGTHIYNEVHTPLLASSPRESIDEDEEWGIDVPSWEYQAALERSHQENLWAKECDERERDIASRRLMHTYGTSAQQVRRDRAPIIRANPDHHTIHVHPPAANVARSQRPSVHSTELPTASCATGTATYEQQTGIIRDTDTPGEIELEKLEASDGSSTSSLRRRGAVKHKTNPLFARPTFEDFDKRSDGR